MRLETSADTPSVRHAAAPRVAEAEAGTAALVGVPRAQAATAAAEVAFTSYLRVAAIAGVVFIHAASGLVKDTAIRGSATWWVGTSLSLSLSWAVPIFIMVSGALLLEDRHGEGARGFYARRLRRIAIPLVVAHVGYFAVRAVLLHERLTTQIVVTDLLRANVYTQLYFFWIVLGLYLVTPLLRTALAGRGRRDLLLIGAAGIGFMWAVQASATALRAAGSSIAVWEPAALTLWIPYLGYFIIGYALRGVELTRRALIVSVGVFAVASAAVVWQYTTGGGPLVTALIGGGYQGLPVATASVSLFLIARSLLHPGSLLANGPTAATMRRLGDLSLGVFVVHLLIIRYAWRLPGLAASTAGQSLTATLVLWAVVLAASFAVCAVLARIPILRRTIGM